MKKYSPIDFWNKCKHPNSSGRDEWQPFRYKLHANYIEKNIGFCKKILDFGAGKGGFFPIYDKVGVEKVITYDISDSFEKDIINYGKKFKFKHKHIVDKVLIPSFDKDLKVDAVVCCNSLQHSRPENIVDVIKELYKISYRIVALESYNPERKYKPDVHYCSHNYFKICKDNEWVILNTEYPGQFKQLHFVVV